MQSDTLDEAIKAFGGVNVQQTGDASTFQKSVCYSWGKDANSYLIFQTTEISGNYLAIAHFTHKPDRKVSCAQIHMLSHSLATKSGLGLGVSKASILRQLGTPNVKTGNKYEWVCSVPDKAAPAEYTRVISIKIEFQNDGASDIEIGSVTGS